MNIPTTTTVSTITTRMQETCIDGLCAAIMHDYSYNKGHSYRVICWTDYDERTPAFTFHTTSLTEAQDVLSSTVLEWRYERGRIEALYATLH